MLSTLTNTLLFLSILSPIFASSSQCYYKGGTQTTNNFKPCFPSDSQTHCCDFNLGETCMSNGLCFVKWDSSLNTGACTDSSWGSSAFFQGCGQFATLYRCNNNNWCCSNGGNTTSCCNDRNVALITIQDVALVQNGSAFIANWTMVPNALLASATPSSATGTATSLSPYSSSPSSSSESSNPSKNASNAVSDSQAVTAGIGAGLGVGIPLLVVIGVLSFLLVKNKAKVRDLQQRLNTVGPSPAYQEHKTEA